MLGAQVAVIKTLEQFLPNRMIWIAKLSIGHVGVGDRRELRLLAVMAVPKVDDVSLVDGVFNGAFGRDGEEDFVMREGFRGRGLCGCHGSRREMNKMIVRMMKMVKVMAIYFGGSGLKK
ncbi:hypothetical protein Tco_0093240 [Tanacetum coccineum]